MATLPIDYGDPLQYGQTDDGEILCPLDSPTRKVYLLNNLQRRTDNPHLIARMSVFKIQTDSKQPSQLWGCLWRKSGKSISGYSSK